MVKKATKKAAKKKVVKKATKKVTKVAKKATKKVVKKATKKVVKKEAKKVATKVTKKVAKKVTKKAAKKTTKKSGTGRGRKGGNPSFMIPLVPSTELAVIVGDKPIARPHVVKKMWIYIKKNNLQDKVDKRLIHADANLAPIWGKKTVISMFEMNKVLKKHLTKAE